MPANPIDKAVDLLEVARSTGLRSYLHGVNATDARELLVRFVAALTAAQQQGQVCECPIPMDDPPDMHAPGCVVRQPKQQRARELLIRALEDGGAEETARIMRSCDDRDDWWATFAIRAIVAALTQQPAAVDEAMLRKLRGYFEGINNDEDGDDYRNLSADAMGLIDSALATQHREPTT